MPSRFSDILDELKALGLNQSKVAEIVGTTSQQISKLKKQQRNLTIDWIDRFSKKLSIPPEEFVSESKSKIDLTDTDRTIIERYKSLNGRHKIAVDKLLGLNTQTKKD